MFVVKRDGHKEPVMFDKITARIKKLCYGLNAAEVAATMTTTHPDYANLASRISVSNLHKNTKKSFSQTMDDLYCQTRFIK